MKELIIIVSLIGPLKVTAYQSLARDTDSTPYHTSIREHVSPYGVAISRDLMCKACRRLHKRCAHPENPTALHYHDLIYIEDVGVKFVNDAMGDTQYDKATKRRYPIVKQIDVWVPSLKAEHQFHVSFCHKKLRVWRICAEEKEREHPRFN